MQAESASRDYSERAHIELRPLARCSGDGRAELASVSFFHLTRRGDGARIGCNAKSYIATGEANRWVDPRQTIAELADGATEDSRCVSAPYRSLAFW